MQPLDVMQCGVHLCKTFCDSISKMKSIHWALLYTDVVWWENSTCQWDIQQKLYILLCCYLMIMISALYTYVTKICWQMYNSVMHTWLCWTQRRQYACMHAYWNNPLDMHSIQLYQYSQWYSLTVHRLSGQFNSNPSIPRHDCDCKDLYTTCQQSVTDGSFFTKSSYNIIL